MKRPVPRLHVITDTEHQSRYSHAELARRAIDGGADGIQFRHKHGAIRDILRAAEETRDVCARANVTFLVNDRLDVALAVDADGLHVGQDDFPAHTARRLLGSHRLLGVSTANVTLAKEAVSNGADYGGLGPVYRTASKATGREPVGVDGVAMVVRGVSLPIIAIGGIRAEHVQALIDAGAHGVAVISAVCCADKVTAATSEFARALGF